MVKVVLASGNRGKLAEFQALLAPLDMQLLSQGELGITAAPEIRNTFVENAIDKARHASRAAGLPALADDSGLVVPALDGAPGILSARYAGTGATDADNNALLLERLPASADRRAWFFCTLVYLRHPLDPAPVIASGQWPGRILSGPRGDGGFGYDPLFLPDGEHRSAAELPAAEKNRLSHRGRAVTELLDRLRALQ